jgi:hypothetical protein
VQNLRHKIRRIINRGFPFNLSQIWQNFPKKIAKLVEFTLSKQKFPNFFCQNNNKIWQPKNIGFELSKTESKRLSEYGIGT